MPANPTQGTRRAILGALAAGSLALVGRAGRAGARPAITVWKDPSCGCCSGWAEHLVRNGFATTIIETSDLPAIKAQQGVPADLAACHTAAIEGYVVEGHVPAAAILRLLAERPAARGLAVPGMPIGSPGMEGGTPEPFDVILFGGAAPVIYQRFLGEQPV